MKKNIVKNKKIIFSIVSMDKGGAERVVSILSNELCKNNDITIVTMVDEKVAYDLDKRIHYICLAENKLKSRNKILKKLCSLINIFIRFRKMKKILKNVNPDVIIAFLPEASFFTALANSKKNKLIISDRNDPNMEYNNIIYKILMRLTYKKADGFVFQTPHAKEFFDKYINFNKTKYDIIVNPINLDFLNHNYKLCNSKIIINVGRLNKQKNQELLIRSFKNIAEELPDYKLEIYGEGPLHSYLNDLINNLNMENRITLMGVSNNIVEKLLNSELFVLSSDYEGIPNALLEAMALGLPVISTDCPCGGPSMFIENGKNGFLVPVDNIEEMTKKIKKVLTDENLKNNIGNNSLNIREKVHPNIIIKKWEEFINKVIGDGNQ